MDPITLCIILAIAGLGVYAASSGAMSSSEGSATGVSEGIPLSLLAPTGGNLFNNYNFGFALPDVAPSAQKGVYKKDFDDEFLNASVRTGVPFALIKAHAIAESSLNPSVSKQESNGRKSYGLTQILWWANSQRFANWGYGDDKIGDGSILYDPEINAYIGAMIMQDNLNRLDNLDDAINAYNTGVRISVRVAPLDYVNKVKKYYSTLIGQTV